MQLAPEHRRVGSEPRRLVGIAGAECELALVEGEPAVLGARREAVEQAPGPLQPAARHGIVAADLVEVRPSHAATRAAPRASLSAR